MAGWKPHIGRDGTSHPLNHLHPFKFGLEFGATAKLAARTVMVSVKFSHHCFTRVEQLSDEDDLYDTAYDVRFFCPERYQHSRNLKNLVKQLAERRCYEAEKLNFVTLTFDGLPPGREYRVFFKVTRDAGNDAVFLYVQSAYVGFSHQRPRGMGKQPIGFRAIVNRVLVGP